MARNLVVHPLASHWPLRPALPAGAVVLGTRRWLPAAASQPLLAGIEALLAREHSLRTNHAAEKGCGSGLLIRVANSRSYRSQLQWGCSYRVENCLGPERTQTKCAPQTNLAPKLKTSIGL